jgi:hypothetical protein
MAHLASLSDRGRLSLLFSKLKTNRDPKYLNFLDRKKKQAEREKTPEYKFKQQIKKDLAWIVGLWRADRKRWRGRQYYKNNPELREMQKARNQTFERREYVRQYSLKKYRESPQYRVNALMAKAIRDSLKKHKSTETSGSKWLSYVNYSKQGLINHLKKSLENLPGYTWQDFMNGDLHIDHIKPKSLFNYNSPFHPEFALCWGLDNLQLLPAIENIKKGDKDL